MCDPRQQQQFGDVNSMENAQPFGSNTTSNNNYARSSGQNVGNFLTDKPSSRVLAPPGGKSQVSYLFGGD